MENMTYEKAISRLEEIVSKLEGNEIPLEDSIALFQEGIELSKYCDDKLKNYENGQLKDMKTEE